MVRAVRATAAPARSISTSTGSGAAASMAAISSGVTIGVTAARRYEGGGSVRGDHCHGDGAVVAQRQVPAGDAAVDGQLRGAAGDAEGGGTRRGDGGPHAVEPE